MSDGFKSFLAEKKARASQALKFFEYKHDMHEETAKQLKSKLAAAWLPIVNRYDAIEDEAGQKKKNNVELLTTEKNLKRSGVKFKGNPIVQIGGLYSEGIKKDIKKELLAVSLSATKKVVDKMNKDVPGDPFSVSQQDGKTGDIRVKFETGMYSETIFLIGAESQYKFDSVYLRDFLDS